MTIKQLIEEIVAKELKLSEALRGFNFKKFVTIENLEEKIAFAEKTLPFLGKGSSRIVFAISSGKVLKIARNEKGLSQNKAEVEVWTNPKTKPVVAKIFSADLKEYHWLISEIVNPFENSTDLWKEQVGLDYEVFSNIVFDWDKSGQPNIETWLQETAKTLQAKLTKIVNAGQEGSPLYNIVRRKLVPVLRINKSPIMKGVMYLIQQGLVSGDLVVGLDNQGQEVNNIDHFGKTIDGRIVVLDYGYTEEVYLQHYKS